MRIERSYGNLIYNDGTIDSKITYYFDSLTELLDFRETLEEEHICSLDNLKVWISTYVEFERRMVEGGNEEE